MVKENDIITDGTTKWKVRRLGGSSDGNPIGTIIMYAANTMPEGYLLCDGSAVSRMDYAELFKVIGTTWGAGDGSTTFNLPNAVGRFAEGSATAGGYIEAGLPNITGAADMNGNGAWNLKSGNSGAYAYRADNPDNIPDSLGVYAYAYAVANMRGNFTFNASYSNATYGKSATVQPPTIQ